MKKILFYGSILFACIGIVTFVKAQVVVKVDAVCDETKKIFDFINRNYNEMPVILASDEDSKVVFLGNSKTKSWTIVQFNDKAACILTTGTGYEVLPERKL